MSKLNRTGHLLTVAALAASTTLSGPAFLYAQEAAPMRLAQAASDEGAPAEEAPPEQPAAEPQAAPEPEPQPEAAPEPEPAPEPEAAAPEAAAPAPEPEAAPEPQPEAPQVEEAAPEAPAAEAPAEDVAPAAPVPDEPAAAAPAPETPAQEAAPEAAPAPTPAPEAPAAAPDDAAAPSSAPQDQPTAPDAAPETTQPQPPATEGSTPPAEPQAPAAPPAAEAPVNTAPAEIAPPAPAQPAAPADATPPASSAPTDSAPATPGDGSAAVTAVPDPSSSASGTSTSDLTPAVPGQQTPEAAAAAQAAASVPPVAEKPTAVPQEIQNAPVQQGAIDQSDARVQTLAQPVVVQSVTVERGERLQKAPEYVLPPKTKVVKRVGGRDIISIAGAAAAGAAVGAAAGYFIRSNDDERLAVDSRDRYVERLPRGRTRETIVRDNGSQVVTISNEYGDVVQRSRITPDGREVVLFYDPYSEDEARPDYYDDPGEDLPPLELTIPRDRYIVDIDEPDEELYYDTISAPPVETVGRIYSVDEVRRSSRIRDKVRRIDLNTINFDFGSAAISQDEVKNLQALADAVARVIKDNPGETFLIEGHTDAVGSNVANLALSDQRAEAVATALSQYFDVPAENLVTQGYGEEDLKVNTQAAERANRRVTLRRITSLVKPVRSATAK